MDRRLIRRASDQPVEGVHLAHKMTLAEPADCRVARHRPDRRPAEGHQSGPRTRARGRSGRLAARMASADDDHIKPAHRASR